MKIYSKAVSITLAVMLCTAAGGSVSADFVTADGVTKYETSDGNYITSRRVTIGGSTYYFDSNGVMRTGLMKLKSGTYYFDENGVMQTGLQKINGTYYYFDENGVMQTGLCKVGRYIYAFGEDGRFVSKPDGWVTLEDGTYYCKKGMMQKGIITLKDDGDNAQYYFDESGKLVADGQAEYKLQTLYIGADGVVYRISDNTSSKRRELKNLRRQKTNLEEDLEKYREDLVSARKAQTEALSDYGEAQTDLDNALAKEHEDNTTYDDDGNAVYAADPNSTSSSVTRAQKKVDRCKEKYDKYTEKISDINKDIADAQAELNDVNKKIAELEALFKEAGANPEV